MVTSQAQSRPALSLAPDSGGKGRVRRTSARLNIKEVGGDEETAVEIVQGKDTRASRKKRKAGERPLRSLVDGTRTGLLGFFFLSLLHLGLKDIKWPSHQE